MMVDLLGVLYSWPFAVGLVAGVAGRRLYCYSRARWLDQHAPLPGGEHHNPGHLNRVWVGGLVAVAIMGYSVLKVQETQDRTLELTHQLAVCNNEFNEALRARSNISTQDNNLSTQISDIRSQIDDSTGNWINRLINPPPDIAGLPAAAERRLEWNHDVTVVYFQRTGHLRDEIAKIVEQRKALQEERANSPLPDPRC